MLAGLLLAAISLALFVWIERRSSDPLLPLAIFASRLRSGAYVVRLCFIGAAVSYFFFETQLLQQVLGFTPLQAGLGFLPMTLTTFFTALQVPRLTRALGNATLLCIALAVMAIGMLWLAQAGADASYWSAIALPMVLLGIGNGGALGPMTIAGVSGVAGRHQSAASGAVNVAHQLGGSLGLSVLAAVFAATQAPGLPLELEMAQQVSQAIQGAGELLLVALGVAVVCVWPAERRKP